MIKKYREPFSKLYDNIKENENYKNVFWIYFFSYLAAPLAYIIKIIFARNLTLEEFGLLYSIIGFYLMLSIFVNWGLPQTFNYYGVKYFEQNNYKKFNNLIYFSFIFQSIITIVLIILIIILNKYLESTYFSYENSNKYLLGFIIYFIFLNLNANLKHIYISLGEVKKFKTIEINILLSSIILIPIILLNSNIISAIIILTIPQIIVFIYYFILLFKINNKIKIVKNKICTLENKKILSYSTNIFLGVAALLLITRIDIIIITKFIGVVEVGIYEVIFSISMIIATLILPILQVLFPNISKYEKEVKIVRSMIFKSYSLIIFLSLIIITPIFIFSEEIISFLFGNSFVNFSIETKIMIIAIFFYIIFQSNFSILSGLNELKKRNLILLIGGTLNIILNILLIKKLGFIGVFISTLIVFIFLSITTSMLVYYRIKLQKT